MFSILLQAEPSGLHQILRDMFQEGGVLFMSGVALALILGLAFCIERIIYLSLSEINQRKFVAELDALLEKGDLEGAKDKARNTVGPVASICYQGLLRVNEPVETIDRSVESYANVQLSLLEKGASWIKLCIGIAPSLGFLGTVIGMFLAFEKIELTGDSSPSSVAEGMKMALITTIFGIIVAVILQIFYQYIMTKIDRLTAQMEESAISLVDSIEKYKKNHAE